MGAQSEVANLDGQTLATGLQRRRLNLQDELCSRQLRTQTARLTALALLDIQAGKQLHHLRDGVPLRLGEAPSRMGDAVNDQLDNRAFPLRFNADLLATAANGVCDEFLGWDQARLSEASIGAEISLLTVERALEEDKVDVLDIVDFIALCIAARLPFTFLFAETEDHKATLLYVK